MVRDPPKRAHVPPLGGHSEARFAGFSLRGCTVRAAFIQVSQRRKVVGMRLHQDAWMMTSNSIDPTWQGQQHAFEPRVLAHRHIVGQLIVCGTCGRVAHNHRLESRPATARIETV